MLLLGYDTITHIALLLFPCRLCLCGDDIRRKLLAGAVLGIRKGTVHTAPFPFGQGTQGTAFFEKPKTCKGHEPELFADATVCDKRHSTKFSPRRCKATAQHVAYNTKSRARRDPPRGILGALDSK
ncbi:hypothetical protein GCM10010431_74350 [Streptomyces kunmingensis]